MMLISGEPGIGKSRLIAAFQERLHAEPHVQLRYYCSPYHISSSLHPVIQQLERATGLNRDDSSDTKLDKLEALLRQSFSDITEITPLLAELLSIDFTGRYEPLKPTPQAQKARTLSALLQHLTGLVTRQSAVILIEDVHWIDPTTLEWLDTLVDSLKDLPVLLIITFRPEFEPHWTRSHVATLSLDRLRREDGEAIIDRVAAGKSLPREISDQILAKTEGIPLFVEELTKTVLRV